MNTFVTALVEYCENRTYLTTLGYLDLFKPFADSGIHFHVFLQKKLYEQYVEHIGHRDTIHITTFEFEEMPIYHECIGLPLPTYRNLEKDTNEFMILMNSKTEFVKRAIENNVFQSTHFAWIDFGIYKIIKNVNTLQYLKDLVIEQPGLYMPVINNPYTFDFLSVCWRFCGGFFIGDMESILNFHSLYEKHFLNIIKENNVISWEINIWAHFEREGYFNPNIYSSNHDDSMLLVPRK
jgi:hypothetical protein